MCVFIFILLCMFNMFNQAIFPQLLVGLTFFLYLHFLICMFGGRLPGYIPRMFTDEVFHSGCQNSHKNWDLGAGE